MSSIKFQDPYYVEVDNAVLTSSDGSKNVDLKDYLISISIVEDIYSHFIHCELNIYDYESLSTSFPLLGEEYFRITFYTDKQEQTTYDFLMYKNIAGGFSDTNKMQYYTLVGVSLDKVIDSGLSISKSYSNLSYAGIVDKIFNDYFSKLNKRIFIEPTKGIQKFIVPGISPFQAVELCKKRSIPVKEPYSPYLFFQNQNGFFYTTFDGLYKSAAASDSTKILHSFVQKLPRSDIEERSVSPLDNLTLGDNSINDVISFDVVEKYNTIDKIKNNAFYGTTRYFDVTTKSFSVKEFNVNKYKNNYKLGNNGGEFNTGPFINNFLNAKSAGPLIPVNSARVFDGSTVDYFPDAYSSMQAYLELIIQERVNVNIYGDNKIKAGDSFNLGAILPNGKLDPTVGGSYLISTVKHLITFDTQPRYINSLECIRGNFMMPIGDIVNAR
jgi:hypothetical protein